MIHERYVELMNREIDGATSEAERAELERYLESSEEARAYYRELQETASLFESAGEVEPPENIDRTILSRIAEREALRAAGKERLSVRALLSPRKKLAYAFAAGIAVGLVILVLVYRSFPGTSTLEVENLYGAFTGKTTPGRLLSVEPLAVDAPNATGELKIRYLENAVLAEVNLDAAREIEIILTPAERLPFDGFRWLTPVDYTLTTGGGSIGIKCTGACGCLLGFRDEHRIHPPMEVRMLAGGKVILETTVHSGRK